MPGPSFTVDTLRRLHDRSPGDQLTFIVGGDIWDPDYYRTYSEQPGQPGGYMSVQSEVTRALKDPTDFRDVARGTSHWRMKSSGMARDTATDSRPAFVVDDGNYISARWPGDTHTFAGVVSDKLRP